MMRDIPKDVDILILGAGWTSTFLIPQLNDAKITHAETTTTGRNGTIPFKFDPESSDPSPYKLLPASKTVLITFPLKSTGQSKRITSLYREIHGQENKWIQLGSSGIFNVLPSWSDSSSPYDTSDPRAIAEDELISLGGCVLNLSGLWGGERVPRNWLGRLAKTKEDVRKRSSVHFVHGEDVSRAIIAVHEQFSSSGGKGVEGKRWIISDLRVYDWYDLIMSFSALTEEKGESREMREMRLQFGKWVGELMEEEGVKALPRPMEGLGRKIDSRGFWMEMGIWPRHARLA